MPAPAPAPVPQGQRSAGKKELHTKVKALSLRQEGGFVLVEGQAGMGKTALLKDLEKMSMVLGIRVLKGLCSAIDETTPLRVFSFVMRVLLDLDSEAQHAHHLGPDAPLGPGWLGMGMGPLSPHVGRVLPRPLDILKDILKGTGTDADLSKDAPLLAPILGPENVPDGPTVRLSTDKRQERLLALCVELMRRAWKRHPTYPTLLLLDNVQWMDEVSWKLVRMLHKDVPELLIVACIRSEGPPPSVGLSLMSSSLPHAAIAFLKEAQCIPHGRPALDSHTPLPPTRQLTLSSDTHVEAVFGNDALLPLVYASFPAQPAFGWAGLACTCSLLHKRRPAWTKGRNLVRLHPLLEDDLEDMAHKLLDVKTIPPALSSFLLEKSEGNPFYISEIMGFLKRKGHVKPTDDNASVEICNAKFAAEFNAQFASTGLHWLLMAQLEALPARNPQEKAKLEQLLKSASVFGESFSSRQVRELHTHLSLQPTASKIDSGLGKLRELRQLGYISEQLQYCFRSSIVRDYMYTSLTFGNYKMLHKAAAELLLKPPDGKAQRQYLAALWHAARAENEPMYLSLVSDAAQQALTGTAWNVALDTLEHGEELVASRDERDVAMTAAVEALPPGTFVRWEEMRGEALLGDNKPELAYAAFKSAFKKGVEEAGIALAPPKEEKPKKGLMGRIFGGKKKEKEEAAEPSPDAIAGLRSGLRAHSTLARSLLESAADSAADVAASLTLLDRWEMKEHLQASLAAAAALPLCVERVLTQAFGVIYLSLKLRRDAPVNANALKTAKPLLEPQLKGLVEYCGSQGSSISESVLASAGAERRASTVGASRPAPAAADADSPAAIVLELAPRGRLELSDPTVHSMALLAIGIAPMVSRADSAGLLERAVDLAKKADDQRMQRICEYVSDVE